MNSPSQSYRGLLAFAASVCVAISAAVAAPISIEVFAADLKFSRARLSPDGRYLASLNELDGESTLILTDLETRKMSRVTPGRARGFPQEVSSFRWVSDHRISFVTTIWDGVALTGVTAVDRDGKRGRIFSGPMADRGNPNPLFATRILHAFEDPEQHVLMVDSPSRAQSDLVYPDVIKLSTVTAFHRTIVKNPGNVISWAADSNGVVRIGITRDGLRFGAIYRENETSDWRTLPLFEQSRGVISPVGFDDRNGRLLVAATDENKRRAIYYYDIASEKLGDLIMGHPQFDIIPQFGWPTIDGVGLVGAVTSDLSGEVLGIRYLTDGPRVKWFDPGFAALQKSIDAISPKTVNLIVNSSRDQKRFLFLAFSDRDPGRYYLVDLTRAEPAVTALGERMPGLPVDQMAPMLPCHFSSRDGLTVHGYLTIPPGRGNKNLPLVVMPHGGPTVRDVWGYQPLVQFLASRGYAILQINYRGSPGYGVEFYEKGKRQIGGDIQHDIEDGTRWAIAQGFADPARIAIVGGSYGGFSALFALGRTPELYRCGVSINGVTDWRDIVKERQGELYRHAFLHFKEWIGDPDADANVLGSISPVSFADKIVAPVLIIQGREDRVVPLKQARKMVDALESAGRKPQTLFLAGEGHAIRSPKNRVRLFSELETFLAQHLAPAGVAR